MKYQTRAVTVQQAAHGGTASIHVHVFTGSMPGPTVYLQGNLHGPEVFGTALLVELVREIKKKKDIRGKLIIVPCANPMGVSQVSYNSMVGRWNSQSGANWNRIFPTSVLKNRKDEKLFYKKLAGIKNASIEKTLAAALRSLSTGADYIVDIHTTGSASAEHLFTYPWMHGDFAALGVPIHLSLDTEDTAGAFDESHVIPFLRSLPKDEIPKAATWEAHHHGHIDGALLARRLSQLLNFLDGIHGKETRKKNPVVYLKSAHLQAPIGGYYSWIKNIGDGINNGETYALVYKPDGTIVPAKAPRACILLGTYGVAATAQGEQIALIAYN